MATYYVANDGSGDYTTIAQVNALSLNAGDIVLFRKGDNWRETLTVPSSGNSSSSITFSSYGSGNKPIINGSNLVNSWTPDVNPNVYYATLTTSPSHVLFDSVVGTNKTSAAACSEARNWYWSSNKLYIYCTTDPDTVYTNPGIEASIRNNCVALNGKSYVTIDSLDLRYAKDKIFYAYTSGSDITLSNCSLRYGYNSGIRFDLINNVTITGNSITGNLVGTDTSVYNNFVMIRNCVNGLISQNSVIGTSDSAIDSEGIFLRENSTGFIISHNTVSNVGGHGIECGNAVRDCTIEYNEVYGGGSNGTGCQGINIGTNDKVTNPTNNIIVRNNYVHDQTVGGGIRTLRSDSIKIYNNIVANVGGANNTYSIFGIGTSTNSDDNEIYNNTIYNIQNTGSEHGIGISVYSSLRNIIKNNIVHTVKDRLVQVVDTSTGLDMDNNCYYGGSDTPFTWGSSYNFSDWKTNKVQDANSISSDPLFISATDYHLQSTSPCKDAGITLSEVTDDYEGNPRPMGSSHDIGAFEAYKCKIMNATLKNASI